MPIRPFPQTSSRYRSQEFPGAPITGLDQGYLVSFIDGGARGNPGPAGYGVVIEDELGRPVAELSEFLGTADQQLRRVLGPAGRAELLSAARLQSAESR